MSSFLLTEYGLDILQCNRFAINKWILTFSCFGNSFGVLFFSGVNRESHSVCWRADQIMMVGLYSWNMIALKLSLRIVLIK